MIQVKTRRVRTIAGVRRFGQPLESIIIPDYVPNRPNVVIPEGTPLGVDSHDIGRRVRYVGPDAPSSSPVEIEGRLVKFRRHRQFTRAQILDDDGETHVLNVPSDTWMRFSHRTVPTEETFYNDYMIGKVGADEYHIRLYNRRWHVLKDGDWDQSIGKYRTYDEALTAVEDMAKKPQTKRRVGRAKQAQMAKDGDFPFLIAQALEDEAKRRKDRGLPKANARQIDTIKKPFLAEMQRRGLALYSDLPNDAWFTPIDGALKHGTYKRKNRKEIVSELGVVYSVNHIGPVVRPIPDHKVIQAVLESVLAILVPLETKFDAVNAIGVLQGVIEQKSVIKHVASLDGVRWFGLPLGAVIVARGDKDKGEQLPFIWRDRAGKPDKDGYVQYTGSDDSPIKRISPSTGRQAKAQPSKYRVKKKGRQWEAIDELDKVVATGNSELAVLKALNEYTKQRSIKQQNTTGRGSDFIIQVGKRPTPKGMHRPTGDELVKLGTQGYNRRITDIFLYNDDVVDSQRSYGYGFDRNGQQSRFMKSEAVAENKKQDFLNVQTMVPLMPAWVNWLQEHWQDNDTNKALWLMTQYGLRVGSKAGARKQKADQDSGFGATMITRSMVKRITAKSVTLEIPSKSAEYARIVSNDPTTVAIIKAAMKGKGPDDQLFPNTNSDKTAVVIKEHFGKRIKNHNLRHYKATAEATAIIQGWLDEGYQMPETYEEMVAEWALPLGRIIDEDVLFDTAGQGWQSYIDPAVLTAVCGKDPSWIDKFTSKYQARGID